MCPTPCQSPKRCIYPQVLVFILQRTKNEQSEVVTGVLSAMSAVPAVLLQGDEVARMLAQLRDNARAAPDCSDFEVNCSLQRLSRGVIQHRLHVGKDLDSDHVLQFALDTIHQ